MAASADIADIGFRADTSDLVNATAKLEAISPAAGKAEKASNALGHSFDGLNAASAQLMAAANGLTVASAKLTAAINAATGASNREAAAVDNAANANSRKAKVVNTAAAATHKAAQESVNAAAAASEEAAAVDKLVAARKRFNSVPIIPREQEYVGPWGRSRPLRPDNDNASSRGNSPFNTANIAAQFQDIGVTAAMGMNPLQIALQQGTQLVLVLQMMEKPLAGILTGLKSLISPLSLIVIGLVAVVAAGLQFVNWISVAKSGLNLLADILPQVATGLAVVGAAFAIAFAPTIAATIWSITTAIASGLLVAIGSLIAAVGAIPIAIGLVIADLIIFRDEWKQVLGIDLVGIAKNAVNYVIGAFVGAYHDIEFLWKQFPDVIGAAAVGAVNLAIKAMNSLVAAALNGINAMITAANTILTVGGIGKKLGFGDPISTIDIGNYQMDTIANEAADRLAKAVGDRNSQLQKDLTTDYLGAIGGAINTAANSAAASIRKFASGLGVDADKKKKKRGGGKTDEEKFDDIINGADRRIASLQAERDAIGLNELATAKLKYETDLLNQAKQKNIDLSPQQRDQLIAIAHGMAELEVQTKRTKEALDFAKSTFSGFVSDFESGIKNGEGLWKSFADAALNAVDKIVDKLLNDLIDAIFEVNSAAGGGSGGGLLGGLLGLFGGGSGGGFSAWDYSMADLGVGLFAKGAAFKDGVNAHSNSIVSTPTMFTFASGAGVMGEAGPEAIMPLARGPDGSLGVQMHGGGASATQDGSGAANVNININLKGANGDKEIQQLVSDGVQQGLEKFNDDVMPIRVNEIVNDHRVR